MWVVGVRWGWCPMRFGIVRQIPDSIVSLIFFILLVDPWRSILVSRTSLVALVSKQVAFYVLNIYIKIYAVRDYGSWLCFEFYITPFWSYSI